MSKALLAVGILIIAVAVWAVYDSFDRSRKANAIAAAELAEKQNALKMSKAYTDDVTRITAFASQWEDEVKLASVTSRIAVGTRVAALQDLNRKWDDITFATPCLNSAKRIHKTYMAHVINAFMEFIAQNEHRAEVQLKASRNSREDFIQQVVACDPTPTKPAAKSRAGPAP